MWNIYKHVPRVSVIMRQYSSALYITGDKASSNFVVLTPYIDFEERLEDKAELENNIKLRGKTIDVDKYMKYWEFYKHLDEKLLMLNATKRGIGEYVTELMKEPEKNKDEIEKLHLHSKLVKENYKSLREYTYPVEESAAMNALSIPNILDKRTPQKEVEIVHTFLEKSAQECKCHFTLAQDKNLIHYLNPTFLVLQNEAAMFEHGLINYGYETLLNHGFISTVNACFSRSIIIEGCCTDHINPKHTYMVHEEDSKYSISKLHFVGNSSLYSFMTYLAKFSIQPGYFPLKFFTSGKQYSPVQSDEKSLLALSQYSTINIISVIKNNEDDNEKSFQDIIKVVKDFYDSLNYHYRLVYLPAKELQDFESLRLSIQMFSMHFQKYIEVGNVSLCGNYLSKRLLVTYNENKTRKYPNIISGTFLNVQKILACVLEYNDVHNKELLSNCLNKYVPM